MKKNNKGNKISSFKIFIMVITLIVFIITTIGYFIYNKYYSKDFVVNNYSKTIVVNYKDEYINNIKVCYGNSNKCDVIEPYVEGEVKTDVIGEYMVKYRYKYQDKVKELDQLVKVQDTEGPTIVVTNEDSLLVCPNGKVTNLDAKYTDNYDEEITDIETKYQDGVLSIIAKDSTGNLSTKEINVTAKDDVGPVITLTGSKSVTVTTGTKYDEKGATAVDACDGEVKVDITNNVDVTKEGKYEAVYTAVDSNNNKTEVKRTITVKNKTAGEKVVYLTFDDGPGDYTNKLLDVLKKYNVKVTFFVTGKGEDSVIKRAYDEGHQIGLHTYSHDYKQIYASQEAFFKDLYKIRDRVKNITGYESNIIRFPGGTSNTVSKISMSALAKEVVNRGFYYFDWNISSGDAGGTTTADGVYYNVINSLKSGTSVVLQHDIKKFSVDAVERIIQYGQANGYTFERLEETSPKIRHGANK